MRGWWLNLTAFHMAVLVVGWGLIVQYGTPLNAQMRHDRSQNVAPVYEGWYKTAGGTVLSFGYLNRNYAEELDIPLGPNNKIEPGPVDQGQPTHFLPRSHHGVFAVTLPGNAQKLEVKWTLTARGRTVSVPANLDPLYEIDALKQSGTDVGVLEANTPPVLRFDPAGAPGVGPVGTTTTLRASISNPVALDVWVTDDGLPKVRENAGEGRSGLSVTWSKYRGPGAVRFSNPKPPIEKGQAHTTATVGEPGDYVLRALASDGSGFVDQCCWTNGYVRVTVGPAGQVQKPGAGP